MIKYFDLIDEFIKVRAGCDDILAEIQRAPITDKASYRRRVVEVCIPAFDRDVMGAIAQLEEEYDPEIVEELVYQLCVDVNPTLEIHQVSLPALRDQDGGLLPQPDQNLQALYRKAMGLQKSLSAQIVGQDEAVTSLVRAVKKSAVGLKPPGRPVGTFLLVGRTGTGKTELAKALARSLHDDAGRLVRIDCSEYALPHEYAKLIGSPPGYIGHSEGGYLTETVKKLQSCVVLFDEIEKAHSKVHNLLLQVLDEGILTDSKGQVVSFAQTVIILTSNLGIEKIDAIRTRMGFRSEKQVSLHDFDLREVTIDALREEFRPEFINRIDEVVLFNPLDHKMCARIAQRMLRELGTLLARQGIKVDYSPGVRNVLAREGYSEEYGARELRRLIKRKIEDPLTEIILNEALGPGARLQVRICRGEPVISVLKQDDGATAQV